jgi:hypothetical protein
MVSLKKCPAMVRPLFYCTNMFHIRNSIVVNATNLSILQQMQIFYAATAWCVPGLCAPCLCDCLVKNMV